MDNDSLPTKFDNLRADVVALTHAIMAMREDVHLLADAQRQLMAILTPAKETGGDNSRAIVLAKMVQAVECQNRMLDDLSSVLVGFVREIPGQVANAVLEASSGR